MSDSCSYTTRSAWSSATGLIICPHIAHQAYLSLSKAMSTARLDPSSSLLLLLLSPLQPCTVVSTSTSTFHLPRFYVPNKKRTRSTCWYASIWVPSLPTHSLSSLSLHLCNLQRNLTYHTYHTNSARKHRLSQTIQDTLQLPHLAHQDNAFKILATPTCT